MRSARSVDQIIGMEFCQPSTACAGDLINRSRGAGSARDSPADVHRMEDAALSLLDTMSASRWNDSPIAHIAAWIALSVITRYRAGMEAALRNRSSAMGTFLLLI
jgi:hypothetical protein